MAADIVQDLELDQEEGTQIPAEDRLAAIRVYLGCFYTETTYVLFFSQVHPGESSRLTDETFATQLVKCMGQAPNDLTFFLAREVLQYARAK